MSSVDDRIVNMKFNNAQFTQGVDKSKRDLTGLEKTIENAGRSKGMKDLGTAVDGVSTKFSALQIAGAAALGTIVTKATSAGLNLVKKLTIQPLIDGFKEYQINLDSVQTIMANTGKSVGVVNKYLEELNTYSDQTIYNFSQMARNIGTFTAAGVQLDTATSAIKGISNLAALSGSSATQASTAMYQLSQAIAAGRVNLQDWNSVVNAGMGGKQFKSALARTAVAMGKLSADAVKVGTDVEIMGKSFRESISAANGADAWLDSDVLVKTLAQLDGRFSETRMKVEGYTKASQRENMIRKERIKLAKQGIVYSDEEFKQVVKMADAAYAAATQIKTFPQLMDIIGESVGSMWANAFSIIMGDFKQSKKLWGAVGDAIVGPSGILSKISEGFLGMLRGWADLGGRKEIIKGLGAIFGGLLDIIYAVGGAFRDVFPPGASNNLYDLSVGFRKFAEAIRPSEQTLESLRSIFGAVFAVLHLGITIIKGVAGAFGSFIAALFNSSEGARGGILSMVAALADVIVSVERWITQGGKLTSFLSGLGKVAGTALSPIVAAFSLVFDAIGAIVSGRGLGGAMDSFERAGEIFSNFFGNIADGLDKMTAPLDPLKARIADFGEKLISPFQPLLDKIAEARAEFSFGLGLDDISSELENAKNKVIDFLNNFTLASIPFRDIGEFISGAASEIKEFANSIDISEKLDRVRESVENFFTSLFGGESSKAASAAEAGASTMSAAAEKTESAFSGLKDTLSTIGDAIKATFGFIGSVIGGIFDALSNIPFPDDALEWATVLNYIIGGAIIKKLFFSKGAFAQLSETIKDIGDSVGDTFGQLTDTLKTMQGAIKSEIIKNIAIAVALLVASLVVLSLIDMEKLGVGLAALATVMAMAGIMMKTMLGGLSGIKPKKLQAQATAMLAVGAAMVMMATSVAILTAAVLALAFVPLDKLGAGLSAVAILMALMVVSMQSLSADSGKIAAVGAAMLLMAMAVDTLVLAVLALAFIPMEKLAQGLFAIGIMIGMLTIAFKSLSKVSKHILGAGAAMVLMAVALDLLVAAIVTLGLLPWSVVEQGLMAVAAGLGIFVIALLVLAENEKGALAAGAAILMMATALSILVPILITLGLTPWDVIAAGLIAMGIAMGILVVAGLLATKAAVGLAALGIVIFALGAAFLMAGAGMFLFASGLAILTTVGVAAIGIMVLAIGAFIAMLPQIAIQVAAAFVQFIAAVALAAPKIRKHMVTIGREMIGTVNDLIPELGKLFDTLVATAITSIENGVPRFVEAGFTIIDEFLKSAEEHVPNIVDSATALITNFMDELGESAGELADAGLDMVVDLLDGIADAVENSNKVRDSAWNLVEVFADEVREAFAEVFGKINPLNYIPNVSLSDLRGKIPGLRGDFSLGMMAAKGSNKPSELAQAIRQAADAISNAAKTLVNNNKDLYALIMSARGDRRESQFRTTYAEVIRASADEATSSAEAALDNAKSMSRGKKGSKKRERRNAKIESAEKARNQARRMRRLAEQAELNATAAMNEADYNEARARDQVTYKDDQLGYGQARSDAGSDLADRSSELAAIAEAKVKEAARLERLAKKGGANSKKYLKLAKDLRKEAASETAESLRLSAQAIRAQEEAVIAYEKARRDAAQDVVNRMEEIRKQREEEAEARRWQEEYDKADNAGKEAMLRERIKTNEDKLKAAEETLLKAYKDSDEVSKRIANNEVISAEELAAIQKALADAEKAAEEARAASDAVEADLATIEQLNSDTSSSGSGRAGGDINPSRTALEDAAKAVDRYTQSVAQAEEMALAGPSTTQFVQNNYSPEALSASEIYRQTNNLISVADIKMGVG